LRVGLGGSQQPGFKQVADDLGPPGAHTEKKTHTLNTAEQTAYGGHVTCDTPVRPQMRHGTWNAGSLPESLAPLQTGVAWGDLSGGCASGSPHTIAAGQPLASPASRSACHSGLLPAPTNARPHSFRPLHKWGGPGCSRAITAHSSSQKEGGAIGGEGVA
jgi:hypothetical protein